MNNEKMVTRCPQCGTSFRITPVQLQSARGAVRCGACLHIFKAREHLIGAAAPARKATPRPSVSTPGPDKSRPPAPGRSQASGAERQDIDQAPRRPRNPPASARRQTRAPAPDARRMPSGLASNQASASPGEATRPASQAPINSASGELDDDDFLISDDMGKSSAEKQDPFGIARQADVSTHSLFERATQENDIESESKDDTDESWAMSLLEDEEEDASSAATASRASEAQQALDDQQALDEEDFEARSPSYELAEAPTEAQLAEATGDDAMRFHLEEEPEPEQSDAGEPMRAHHSERSALLMNIDPGPVEMNWARQRQRHRIQRKWLWSGLAALALLTLAGQFAWLQFDRLSRVEPYRSGYELVCSAIGCEVPALVDRSRIRAYNLVVRHHPDQERALVVDAILLNTARFSQPFPALVLEFSDLNGTALAARAFKPGEYLSGELAGREVMPPNQPIHLTLELVDPGEQAVNYRAYIPD